jgi:hypothetical protein
MDPARRLELNRVSALRRLARRGPGDLAFITYQTGQLFLIGSDRTAAVGGSAGFLALRGGVM